MYDIKHNVYEINKVPNIIILTSNDVIWYDILTYSSEDVYKDVH